MLEEETALAAETARAMRELARTVSRRPATPADAGSGSPGAPVRRAASMDPLGGATDRSGRGDRTRDRAGDDQGPPERTGGPSALPRVRVRARAGGRRARLLRRTGAPVSDLRVGTGGGGYVHRGEAGHRQTTAWRNVRGRIGGRRRPDVRRRYRRVPVRPRLLGRARDVVPAEDNARCLDPRPSDPTGDARHPPGRVDRDGCAVAVGA